MIAKHEAKDACISERGVISWLVHEYEHRAPDGVSLRTGAPLSAIICGRESHLSNPGKCERHADTSHLRSTSGRDKLHSF